MCIVQNSVYFKCNQIRNMKKIRIGIELNHVIRNINKQIAKYYQQDYDESVDLDEINYKSDVLNTVCHFKSDREKIEFLYELYPLEIYGHANQMDRSLSRDLNAWIKNLENQEEYDVEIFFYSLKEYNITIQSSYFFLSKIGSRVRKVIFPKTIDELATYGDVFITTNNSVVENVGKPTIIIKMDFNQGVENNTSLVYEDFRSFLNDEEKLNKISVILDKECQKHSKNTLWTWMQSWISSFAQKKKEM